MTDPNTIPVSNEGRYIITLPIDQIKVSTHYRQEMGDPDTLAASIKKLGQLQPIGLDRNRNLIHGERRRSGG